MLGFSDEETEGFPEGSVLGLDDGIELGAADGAKDALELAFDEGAADFVGVSEEATDGSPEGFRIKKTIDLEQASCTRFAGVPIFWVRSEL
jgi:hypothetical protein